MEANHQKGRLRLPIWAVGLLAGLVVLAGGGLFWLEDGISFPPKTALGWVLLVIVVAPLYLLLEVMADAGADGLWSDRRFLVRAIPIVLVVLLYVLWYATR